MYIATVSMSIPDISLFYLPSANNSSLVKAYKSVLPSYLTWNIINNS
jgi:hypothetical protein